MSPLVVAVIVNYNRPNDTIECIRSLRCSQYPALQILVVDNGSSDNSIERFQSECGDVELLATKHNLGFTGGNNKGIEYSFPKEPTFILLLNNDTLVEPDFLGHLVAALEGNKDAAAASATVLYYPDTNTVWYGGGRFRYWRGASVSLFSGKSRKWLPKNQDVKTTFVTGCAVLLRTDAIRHAGKFDERYFMYFEDAELSLRLIRNGYRLMYVPQSLVYHKVAHHGDTPFALYYGVRNRFLFIESATEGLHCLVAQGYLYLVFGVKLLVWTLTNRGLAEACVMGWWDYVRREFGVGRGNELKKTRQHGVLRSI